MAQSKNLSPIAVQLREAVKRHRAGALDEAASLYAKALEIDPHHADALHLSGLLAHQQGRHADAEALITRAIAAVATVPDFHHSRGLARRAGGKADGAVADFTQAATLNPDYVEAWINLGLTQLQRQEAPAARAAFARAVELAPDSADLHGYLGTAELQCGRLNEAIAALKHAIRLNKDFSEAHYNLGVALERSGDAAAAETAWRRAIETNPFYMKPWTNLAVALQRRGRGDEAKAMYERALSHAPPHSREAADLWNNFAVLLDDMGKVEAALQAFERAVQLQPRDARLQLNFGTALLGVGRTEAALRHIAQAHDFDPKSLAAANAFLLALLYINDDPQAQLEAARRWAGGLDVSAPAPHANRREPERRLRIGYVSPDFCAHVVARFIEPVLAAHDRAAVELFCYAEVKKPDDVTARLRGLVDHWRDTTTMNDAALIKTIRADGIDILIDLAGHTIGSRLTVFAAKPAPIQATWLGYPATTGLTQIDWRISDALADPPGLTERDYTEKLLRLPGGFDCYRPPAEAGEVAPVPSDTAGHVTFGCFNHAAKLRDEALDAWAQLLGRVPDSRLLIKHRGFESPPVLAGTREALRRRGVATERIELASFAGHFADHLAAYGRVDVALDSFPYNGTTTTCEALWMGVPVVTFAGRTHRARVGASLLTRVGLPELVGESPQDYVEIAARLAEDRVRLRGLRASLRARMAASPLCDGAALTRDLEAALRDLWRQWCRA